MSGCPVTMPSGMDMTLSPYLTTRVIQRQLWEVTDTISDVLCLAQFYCSELTFSLLTMDRVPLCTACAPSSGLWHEFIVQRYLVNVNKETPDEPQSP